LQPLGKFPHCRPLATGESLNLQQQQILQDRDSLFSSHLLAKTQKAPELVAKLGERLVLGLGDP